MIAKIIFGIVFASLVLGIPIGIATVEHRFKVSQCDQIDGKVITDFLGFYESCVYGGGSLE